MSNNRILLIRHAETDLAGTFCGHSDPDLNAHGLSQLPPLLEKLSPWLAASSKAPMIVSSDLKRAQQTASAIAEYFGGELSLRAGLREIHFGQLEGLSWKAIEAAYPDEASRWVGNFPHITPPGGESYPRFLHRIATEADALRDASRHSTLVVVTHAGAMRALLQHFGMPEQQCWTERIDYATVIPVPVALLDTADPITTGPGTKRL